MTKVTTSSMPKFFKYTNCPSSHRGREDNDSADHDVHKKTLYLKSRKTKTQKVLITNSLGSLHTISLFL